MLLPDLAAILKGRLESPGELLTAPDPAALGAAILRQLRQAPEATGPGFRASQLGRCIRQLAFHHHGVRPDGREVDYRARATFALGDVTELLLVTALAEALATGAAPGWRLGEVRGAGGQGTVELALDVPTPRGGVRVVVPGHPDGILHGPGDLPGQPVALLEVKSTSSYGFTAWERSLRSGAGGWGPGDAYWWQLQAYLHSVGAAWGYVLALCKDSGAIAGWWQERDEGFPERLSRRLSQVVSSAGPHDVPREGPGGPIGPVERIGARGRPLKGHGDLPSFPCGYCAWYRPCWGPRLEERVSVDWRGRPSRALRLREETEGGEGA
ncbi:hypothetical protein L6R50_22200 [Myxococcota bacterium]|nr:hypothetical protein [Myxococcota bacterium]